MKNDRTAAQRERIREYGRDYRRVSRRLHICVQCGKKDAYTMVGESRCFECAEKAKAYSAKRYQEKKPDIIEKLNAMRNGRKASGLCIECGAPAVIGKTRCQKHLTEARRRSREYRERRADNAEGKRSLWSGVCTHCGGPAEDGKKLCARCYDMKCGFLETARARQRELKAGARL